jgi:hypothetical protein
MTYKQYIASQLWQTVRQKRLDFDDHKCVVCKAPATSVHHLRYPEKFGEEDIVNDLISVCKTHHPLFDNLERWTRYEKRQHVVTPIPDTITQERSFSHGKSSSNLQADLIGPANHAQRRDGRSNQQVCTFTEADFI